MITFKASIRSAIVDSDDAVTTGSVGIPIKLELDTAFNGLAKTLVCRTDTVSVDIALVGDADEAVLPADILNIAGKAFQLGIYAANGAGDIVIPTIWAAAGIVVQGVLPSGVDPASPTPSWVAQVQTIASEALINSEHAINVAETSANSAYNSAQRAAESANQAGEYSQAAAASADDAATSEVNAAGSAQAASESAISADESANRAEQVAITNGYMEVRIVDGHLIYERTDAVDTDFRLDAIGHLIMESIAT